MTTGTTATPPAGWLPDPDHRHEYRYFDGAAWTEWVADHGLTSQESPGNAPAPAWSSFPPPEPAAPVQVAATAPRQPAEEGRFTTRWIAMNKVSLPRICCVCGRSGAFDQITVGGSDWAGKLSASVGVPLCSPCAETLAACGVKQGKASGGLIQSMRVPAELKPEYKHITHAASFSLRRQGFGDIGIKFTFTNRRFYEAFEAANPKK